MGDSPNLVPQLVRGVATGAIYSVLCAYAMLSGCPMDGNLLILWRSMGGLVDQVLGLAVEVSCDFRTEPEIHIDGSSRQAAKLFKL